MQLEQKSHHSQLPQLRESFGNKLGLTIFDASISDILDLVQPSGVSR